jgi:hypothetical protein
MATATDTRDFTAIWTEPDVEEGAARAALRGQIDRLESRLAGLTMDLWEARHREALRPISAPRSRAPRLLTLGELEAVRDALVSNVRSAERVLDRCAETQTQARATLESMLADPPAHRFEVVTLADIGEPGCGAYQVLPRLGLLGMMFGWWCVKLSSGCPLAMPYPNRYYSRKSRNPWGRHAKLELALTIIVVVAVIATILVFLLVFHDIPFRSGEPT